MSYEIVRNLKVVNDNNGYYAIIKSSSNNIRPLDFNTWTYGKGKNYTKEQLEKHLLLDFYYGNFKGGNSKYNTITQLADNSKFMDRFKKLSDIYYKIWRVRYNRGDARKQELIKLQDKLDLMRDEEARKSLYAFMLSKPKKVRFMVRYQYKDGSLGAYVKKINKNTYRESSEPHIFDNPKIYNEVCNREFWKEHYKVIVVE